MTYRKPSVDCGSCGRRARHNGHGWCNACWDRWNRAGRPGAGPPPPRIGRYAEYTELRLDHGYTIALAAMRMGVSRRTAERYEARLKAQEAAT